MSWAKSKDRLRVNGFLPFVKGGKNLVSSVYSMMDRLISFPWFLKAYDTSLRRFFLHQTQISVLAFKLITITWGLAETIEVFFARLSLPVDRYETLLQTRLAQGSAGSRIAIFVCLFPSLFTLDTKIYSHLLQPLRRRLKNSKQNICRNFRT